VSLNTWCTCIKVTRRDGLIFGLTDTNKGFEFEGLAYNVSNGGMSASNIEHTSNLSVNNADAAGLITLLGINRSDLVAGLYDYAGVEFLLYDYVNALLVKILGVGTLGEVTISDNSFNSEFRSISQKLHQKIGAVYTAECGVDLGDSKCRVNLSSFTYAGSITSFVGSGRFSDSALNNADNFFDYGLITFTDGLNANLSREVKLYSSNEFQLLLPFPYAVSNGDSYSIYGGCDKAKSTCISKFNNVINFRGFDFIPGSDQVTKFGGQ